MKRHGAAVWPLMGTAARRTVWSANGSSLCRLLCAVARRTVRPDSPQVSPSRSLSPGSSSWMCAAARAGKNAVDRSRPSGCPPTSTATPTSRPALTPSAASARSVSTHGSVEEVDRRWDRRIALAQARTRRLAERTARIKGEWERASARLVARWEAEKAEETKKREERRAKAEYMSKVRRFSFIILTFPPTRSPEN